MEYALGAVIGIAVLVVLKLLVVLVLTRGDLGRVGPTISASLKMLADQAFLDKVRALLTAESKPPAPPKPSGEPLRLLTLLQRGDGRFLDFVMEDVKGADDSQVVAAVRTMQPVWQAILKEKLVLEPVRPEPEGSTVEVPAGFDPSAILLTGNVTGQPPFRGTLKHPGWRVLEIKLPPLPEGQDPFVIMPAEVELP
jgi:Domain of unknown function (DUF2760)